MRRPALALMFFILIPSLYFSTSMSAIAAENNLELKMTVNRDTVPRGTRIQFTLTLTNNGQNDVTVTFSSGQAFDLYYYTSTGWHRWSDGKAFVTLVWDIKLEPRENFSQTLEWDLYQYDRTSGKFIPPEYGTYYVWGTCVGMPRATTISPTAITLSVPGDVNGDGIVDMLDILKIKYHRSGPPPGPGAYDISVDVNGDDLIDVYDMLIAKAHLGQS